jgi:hypothetical protein
MRTRSSKTWLVGTLLTKAMTSVIKKEYRSFLIEKVLPTIRSKWPVPGNDAGTIYIQQDNAKLHLSTNDPKFVFVVSQDGFDIQSMYQPQNSSNFNVLDLGFFNAIQSL